jgi:hypothetical protein
VFNNDHFSTTKSELVCARCANDSSTDNDNVRRTHDDRS